MKVKTNVRAGAEAIGGPLGGAIASPISNIAKNGFK